MITLQENVDMIIYIKSPGAIQINHGIGVIHIALMTMVTNYIVLNFPLFFEKPFLIFFSECLSAKKNDMIHIQGKDGNAYYR